MDSATAQTIIQGAILVTTLYIAKTTNDIKNKTGGGDDPKHDDPTVKTKS